MERNRRVPNLLSPLALVPENILIPAEVDGTIVPIHEYHQHTTEEQRRPGPEWKIRRSDWPTILRLLDDGMSLRQIANYYSVTYETIRRIANIARQEGMGE